MPDPNEVEKLVGCLEGYARSYDKLHADIAADFRRSAALLSTLTRPPLVEAMEGDITGVWRQAEENHRLYSDTGDREGDIRFLTLGLTGEAGEVMEAVLKAALVVQASGKVANLVKKRWRDGDCHDDEIRKEIADVCAYAFMLANTMGMSPADLIAMIAAKQQIFIDKMEARAALAAQRGGEG